MEFYLPGHRPVPYDRAGAPRVQISCPRRLSSPRIATRTWARGRLCAGASTLAHSRSRPYGATPPAPSTAPTGASCRARACRRRGGGTAGRWRRSRHPTPLSRRRPRGRRRRAHAPTRTRAPARRAVARRRQHAAARHRVRSRHGEPYDDEQLELARVERVGRALWPEKSLRRTAARRRPSRPTWRHSPRRAAACAMSPRHLIDRGGADALGVRVRRRADRRRNIAQRARVRRRSASCRRRPTSAYGSVIRPVLTLCAARRPLSMR